MTDLPEIRSEGRSQDPFQMVFYAKLQFVSKKRRNLMFQQKKKLTHKKRIKLKYLRCLLTDLLEIRSEGRSQDPFQMVFYAKLQLVIKKKAEKPENPISYSSPVEFL